MKKIFYSLLGLMLLNSCSKDDSPNNATDNGNCKVISISDNDRTSKFIYDNKNRITEFSGESEKSSFSYADKNITVQTRSILGDGKDESITYKYTLDAENRIISGPYIDDESIFKYNTEGYLISISKKDGGIYSQFEYANGNISRINDKIYSSSGDYKYDLLKPYLPFTSYILRYFANTDYHHLYVLYEQGYLGKTSKNRIIEESGKVYGYDYIQTFQHKEDSKGNVISVDKYYNATYPNKPENNTSRVSTATLTYDCK